MIVNLSWVGTAPVRPAALGRARLDGRFGAGLDPCAALQSVVEIAPGESREIIILLGESDSAEKARELVARYLETSTVLEAFERVVNYWDERCRASKFVRPMRRWI